jgi:hypothetical protein
LFYFILYGKGGIQLTGKQKLLATQSLNYIQDALSILKKQQLETGDQITDEMIESFTKHSETLKNIIKF